MADSERQSVDISLPLEQSEDVARWREAAARSLRIGAEEVADMQLEKRSIDARRSRVNVRLRLRVSLDGPLPPEREYAPDFPKVSSRAKRLIIVGMGPAGMFAALRAIELGWRPVLLERGKDAIARRFDLAPILREGRIIEDSNYCFGEGGAGTFSDGKLYTRATKRGPVRKVYETFVEHGAPRDILIEAHPHIGSNLLPNVVRSIRETILASGGEVHFESRVSALLRVADGKRISGVRAVDGEEHLGDGVILATGHSARDIYRMLVEEGIRIEQKPFAMGVRVEHPQSLIDSIQYSMKRGQERHPMLPAASYRLATKIDGRGAHSFCMCPGGFIVPAATENDEVVVNGMSLSRRDSAYANSGLVATVEPEDALGAYPEHGPLAGVVYQKVLEQEAARQGGGKQRAPGQRLMDFMGDRVSTDLAATSYRPGLRSVPVSKLLPDAIASRLAKALRHFGKSMRGYLTQEANIIGVETRTSSPVRIPRDPQSLSHPDVAGLYPCGEGAGYAGGIVSAALDGMKCAEAACRETGEAESLRSGKANWRANE